MESGGPETAPASSLKCVVPLMSPEGCFHAATKKKKVPDTIAEEGWACIAGIIGAAPLHLSPGERWPRRWQQQPSEMTTRRCDDSLSRGSLGSFPLFIRMLVTTPACSSLVKLIVSLITPAICKVVVWSVGYDTGGEWTRWNRLLIGWSVRYVS